MGSERILEFRLRAITKKPSYEVRLTGYALDQDLWVAAKDIDSEILSEFWVTEGNIEVVNNSHESTEERLQLI